NINVAGLTSIGVTSQVITTKGRLTIQNVGAPVAGTAATATLPVPTATLTTTLSDVFSPPFEELIIDWGPTGDDNVDFSTALLHPYTDFPALDVATDKVSWPEAASGNDGDLVIAQYSSSRVVASTNHFWTWKMAAPRGTTPSVTFPTIPTTVFDFNPAA